VQHLLNTSLSLVAEAVGLVIMVLEWVVVVLVAW
jgi:hypothetical protein